MSKDAAREHKEYSGRKAQNVDEPAEMHSICQWCGQKLTARGPCPKCGKGRKFFMTTSGMVTFKGTMGWQRRREFFEKNRRIGWLLIVIVFVSPLVGYFLSGVVGLVIGFAFSILSYVLGPSAVTKIREVERGS